MAPRRSRATRIKQQRTSQPKQRSMALKEASREARRELITKRATKTGTKVAFKL